MRFYVVEVTVWDIFKKISNIKEFRQMTGTSLTDAKEKIESVTNDYGSLEIILSAERLGNYCAWRNITNDETFLGFNIKSEYFPAITPTIYG